MPLEIERVFLLDRLPELPPDAVASRIEQGYLPPVSAEALAPVERNEPLEPPEPAVGITEGRVRRETGPDGVVEHTHTVKRGLGLVREETERTITATEFAPLWARTAGRRIAKTRYRVAGADGLVWEIDLFDARDLVLAEIEIPDRRTEITVPSWLSGRVVREVTGEPEYRNYHLACLAVPPGPERGGDHR